MENSKDHQTNPIEGPPTDAASNQSPNGLRQRFDKNDNDEMLILEEKLVFTPGVEQVRHPLEILGIDELEAIGSFSLTMNVKINTNLKNIKSDQIFFQIGPSIMHKILAVGITKDKTFFASCLTQKNKIETCYTQCKVKNAEYHLGVSVVDEGLFTELTIYVNGQNEASLVFPSIVETLQGYFIWGSDDPKDGFQGEISEAMFYSKMMESQDMKECYSSKVNSPGDKSIFLIRKEKKDYMNSTEYYSKKKGLPVTLVRTLNPGLDKAATTTKKEPAENEENKKEEHELSDEEKKKRQLCGMIEEMKDYLYQDENLYFKARDLAFNFEWVFKVCSVLSPGIEERGSQPKHSFSCLHNSLCEAEARYYPCYPITVGQFMKVIAKLDTKLSDEDIKKMAERIDCLDMNKEYGSYIYYDKFLLAVRNATFSKEEIIHITKSDHDEIEKQVIKTEAPPSGENQPTKTIVAYNLIPIFENADYFDQRDFIEANPGAILTKIILSIHKPTNHVKYMHFTYKLQNGQVRDFEVGKPLVSGLTDLVHFTIDINENEFLCGVKASNYHANNANKLISYLSFVLNTHPDGIAYGQFLGHPGELKSLAFDPSEHEDKKILGFYGAFRDDLIGLGVYVEEKVAPKVQQSPEEKKANESPSPVQQQPEEEDEEYILTLPQPKGEWNEGRIQVIINRCADCAKHRTTTTHQEADFCLKFNDWGNKIKDYFPNAEIIGNYDKPKVFGMFEIYVRGVGSNQERDPEGRVFLHQNYTTPEMKTSFGKVLETLMIYCFEYGDSVEMAKAQNAFCKKHVNEIPKRWTGSHDHPVDVPERIGGQTQGGRRSKGQGKLEDGTPVVCKHWACGQRYNFDSMNETVCQHHPGRYEFGSVHGLWPEGWTCCRGAWADPGCKKGKHDPIPVNRYYQLCVNHGDLNPKTGKPDSACGRPYQDSSEECKYHQGYYMGRGDKGKWSCCGESGENAAPCNSSSHKSAEWPDEDAKLYFVTREVRVRIKNPGIYKDNSNTTSFSYKATTSGFYKKTKPYVIYENPQRKRAKEMEETENEPRVCMNWGCGQVYKEVDNKKIKHCKSHPGVWDFGYTGITVSQATTEFNRDNSEVLLWKPHWTCCRQPWAAHGCTKTFHRGPLQSQMVEPKYKWPSEDAQKFFRKSISPLWKAKLENKYLLEPAQVAQKFDDLSKTSLGSGGKINLGVLPQLCDKLKLHLLIISEDLSHHIRFLQVVNHTAEPLLDDGTGNIDKKKFLEWWFAKLDE